MRAASSAQHSGPGTWKGPPSHLMVSVPHARMAVPQRVFAGPGVRPGPSCRSRDEERGARKAARWEAAQVCQEPRRATFQPPENMSRT